MNPIECANANDWIKIRILYKNNCECCNELFVSILFLTKYGRWKNLCWVDACALTYRIKISFTYVTQLAKPRDDELLQKRRYLFDSENK